MSFSIGNGLSEEEWSSWVAENPAGNVFHTPEMFRVFQAARGFQPELWVARDTGGKIQALFTPVRITIKGGLLRVLTTHAVAYGSILIAQNGVAALDPLLESYRRKSGRGAIYTELRNLSDMSEIQPVLAQHQFTFEEHLNYKVNLEGTPDTVFNQIGKRTQRNIRRALNQGHLSVETVEDRSGIDECYQLLSKTYHLARVPLPDRSLFEAAFDQLHPKGMLRVTVARLERTAAAVSFELLYKDVIYGWYGGMDRAFSRYNPNELLMWHILKWGNENGYREYDFGGAGKPDEDYGVRDFKAKFGGRLVNHGRYKMISNRFLYALSTLGYKLYRRFL